MSRSSHSTQQTFAGLTWMDINNHLTCLNPFSSQSLFHPLRDDIHLLTSPVKIHTFPSLRAAKAELGCTWRGHWVRTQDRGTGGQGANPCCVTAPYSGVTLPALHAPLSRLITDCSRTKLTSAGRAGPVHRANIKLKQLAGRWFAEGCHQACDETEFGSIALRGGSGLKV